MIPWSSRLVVVENDAPSESSRLPPGAMYASDSRIGKLAPGPPRMIVASSVAILPPGKLIALLAPTIHVPPVSDPGEKFVGAVSILIVPPPVASIVPEFVQLVA